MPAKRKYKDSVFTALFSSPDLLRELYCALGNVSLPPDVPVSINTLENVLFMDFNNDISFEIGGKLVVLIEHQSTINRNMALRLFLYIARILERTVKGRSLYSGKTLSIPWPEFFVLYNGPANFPDKAVYHLSDLFEKPQDMGLPEKAKPMLELEVKVININEGSNTDLVKRCKKLSEYSAFIAKARSFQKELGNREEAIKATVNYCEKHGILKEFLELYATEVLNMLLTEWNTEDAIAVAREEGFEEGREEGHEEGHEEGLEKGHEDERKYILELLDQGLSPEDIKNLLTRGR